MFTLSRVAAIAAGLLAISTKVQALPKITRAGRYLYSEDGSRFYIKGIAYQGQGESSQGEDDPFAEAVTFKDPLIDGTACQRDIANFKTLGINAIRVYSVDNTQNHDDCMKQLSDAGIYTILDLTLPVNGSINRASPAWTTNLLDQFIKTIDDFNRYDNMLAYNIGNEVITSSGGVTATGAAPFIKAAARDVRAYLDSIKSSALVGYAAINGGDLILKLADYLTCDTSGGSSTKESIDLYGLNFYTSCGSDDAGALDGVNAKFADLPVPAYFSEFACAPSNGSPRTWSDIATLYSSPATNVWSGAAAFSYFPAQSGQGAFGVVSVSSDEKTVTTIEDFTNLANELSKVSPPNTPSQSSAGANTVATCPTASDDWGASNKLPPTPNDAACKCLDATLSCTFNAGSNALQVVGPLIGEGCSLLSQAKGDCNDISGDGLTGTYGRVAFCDPNTKLSFIFSKYYEATNRVQTSCDFAGNATINSNAPSSVSGANAAASSCLTNPSSVFTPSSPADPNQSNGGKPNPNNDNSGALSLQPLVGLGLAFGVALLGSWMTVA